MNLYKESITFQTKELLKAMIDTSELQKRRMSRPDFLPPPDSYLTVMSLGRQCGHTTAITELQQQLGYTIVVPQHRYAKDLYPNVRNDISGVISIRQIIEGGIFRGIRDVRLVFDMCNMNEVFQAINDASRRHLHYAVAVQPLPTF